LKETERDGKKVTERERIRDLPSGMEYEDIPETTGHPVAVPEVVTP
jgi:hypothetical protein